jgi:hypothetical protein
VCCSSTALHNEQVTGDKHCNIVTATSPLQGLPPIASHNSKVFIRAPPEWALHTTMHLLTAMRMP